jgi:hypothetical protein
VEDAGPGDGRAGTVAVGWGLEKGDVEVVAAFGFGWSSHGIRLWREKKGGMSGYMLGIEFWSRGGSQPRTLLLLWSGLSQSVNSRVITGSDCGFSIGAFVQRRKETSGPSRWIL